MSSRSARTGGSVRLEAVEAAPEPVRGADIVVTATNSGEPVLEARWIRGNTQVRWGRTKRALRADLIVADSVEQSRMESGDLLLAFPEKRIGSGWWN